VFARGHVPFTAQYVTRLKSMADRALPAHRFVCLTDRAAELPDSVETIKIPSVVGAYAWWAKLQLFNPVLELSGRVLYLDLDVLLVGDMGPIIGYPSDFALAPDTASFQPRDGRQCVHRFNSSVMVWDHGCNHELYCDWKPEVTKRLWGDQDWIGAQRPGAASMPAEWFPRLSSLGSRQGWPKSAKVVLCKKPKNEQAVQVFPWFDEAWQ
jgi:hypothetical protein